MFSAQLRQCDREHLKTALMWLASLGNIAIVKMLLEQPEIKLNFFKTLSASSEYELTPVK